MGEQFLQKKLKTTLLVIYRETRHNNIRCYMNGKLLRVIVDNHRVNKKVVKFCWVLAHSTMTQTPQLVRNTSSHHLNILVKINIFLASLHIELIPRNVKNTLNERYSVQISKYIKPIKTWICPCTHPCRCRCRCRRARCSWSWCSPWSWHWPGCGEIFSCPSETAAPREPRWSGIWNGA